MEPQEEVNLTINTATTAAEFGTITETTVFILADGGMYTQSLYGGIFCIPYSVFPRSFCAKNTDFRLLRAHMHHTPTQAHWSCGKIFVLSSKRTKRTNIRTDEKKRYTVDCLQFLFGIIIMRDHYTIFIHFSLKAKMLEFCDKFAFLSRAKIFLHEIRGTHIYSTIKF